jgi:hypothetical protein
LIKVFGGVFRYYTISSDLVAYTKTGMVEVALHRTMSSFAIRVREDTQGVRGDGGFVQSPRKAHLTTCRPGAAPHRSSATRTTSRISFYTPVIRGELLGGARRAAQKVLNEVKEQGVIRPQADG